ncbi:MAG: ZIP family metal transporter [Haloferacaceae archaeon]
MTTVTPRSLALVFVAGLITALATGLGALPFVLFDEISDRWNVVLWGLASGIMLAASGFGLLAEGMAASEGVPVLLGGGLLAGVVLVVVTDRLLHDTGVGGEGDHGAHDETDRPSDGEDAALAAAVADGDYRTLVLILGVLTVHSFPEGVAIGVSFADLGLEGGVPVLGVSVPLLAVFMTVAISIHNVPEGTAIAIPLRTLGVSEQKMVGAAVLSSLPQPVGAVIAFAFVRWARAFLPFGFGFAAGAMVYLVLAEFVPEALEQGADLPGRGWRELVAGVAAGAVLMLPLLAV